MTSPIHTSAVDVLCSLNYPERTSSGIRDEEMDELIQILKIRAVEENNQVEAKLLWQAQTIASIQHGFIKAFEVLKTYSYYDAWCLLERCEIDVMALKRYYTPSPDDVHRVEYIEKMIARWQYLYPYKMFFSPEILKKKVCCSICGSTVSLRNNCGHEKYGIYDGEMCYHRVEEVDLLSISAVENPVQKYSVAFLSDSEGGDPKDHYDYGNVRFVVDRVASPFHGWASEVTTRVIKDSDVAHLSLEHPCPCLSGKVFGECCFGKTQIIVPHMQVHLSVPPGKELPERELLV